MADLQTPSSQIHRINPAGFHAILLLAAAAILFFWNLGNVPLFEPDEGRYADMSWNMLKTGDWMVPRMDGITHIHKPPLSNWLMASSFHFLGRNELAARLPGVLLSLILVFLNIRLGKFLFDFKTGLYASWILTTSALYLVISRLVTTDMTLVFFTYAAMFCMAHLFFGSQRKTGWFYLTWFFLACGMLTKGPVAWLITLLPAFIFGIWKRKNIGVPFIHWLIAIPCFLALSLSWYLALVFQNKEILNYFLGYQLGGRTFGAHAGRKRPFHYFLVVLAAGFTPWILYMPAAALEMIRQVKENPRHKEAMQFLLCWFLIPFIFFCIFKTKLATYIVPLFPPLSLITGYFWKLWNEGRVQNTKSIRIAGWVQAIAYAAAVIGGLIFISMKPEFVRGISHINLTAIGLVFFAASGTLMRIILKNKWKWLFPFQIVSLALIYITAFQALPSLRYKNTKYFVEKIQALRKPGDKVVMWGKYFSSLPFYFDEYIPVVGIPVEANFEKPEKIKDFLIEDKSALNQILNAPPRVFVLTYEKQFRDIRNSVSAPFHVLSEEYGLVLLSNKP